MDIKWIGTLNIKDANGKVVQINTKPRTGAGNKQLWDVGTPYDVVKKPNDAPHCSVNGH